MRLLSASLAVLIAAGLPSQAPTVRPANPRSPFQKWKNGLPDDPDYFPIGVWLQSARNAKRYRDLGINLYVGQWKGPTDRQMKDLQAAGMPLVGAQSAAALRSAHVAIVRGWSQQDEPDNAQRAPNGGWGPPVSPAVIAADYRAMTKADPTRPVFLNLGQGVANDNWKGRGTRAGHLEDYPEYIRGTDIVSFDIYPVVHSDPAIQGRLEYVAKGVERLVKWSRGKKVVWNFIECTHIHSKVMPTPAQVRTEVWMSLVHGSRGILYFAHEWQPSFVEAGLLKYPAMTRAVKSINAEIRDLAPVLNSPTVVRGAAVRSSVSSVPVALMLKRHRGASYLFAVAMRKAGTRATFTVKGLAQKSVATVIGEDRQLEVAGGVFRDDFSPYGVHLYRIHAKALGRVRRKIPVPGRRPVARPSHR